MIEALLIALVRLLTGAVVRSHGFSFEPSQQRIYYANHTSHMDTLLIWSLIPRAQRERVHPAAAQDYWWTSQWRRFVAERIFHAVPVVRQRVSSDEDPLQAVAAVLAQGDSLIFFPEGTRGTGNGIQPFRNGLYHLAHNCPGIVLVPVYISNLNRVLPKGEFLPVPIICTVTFGSGFTLEAEEPRAAFIARARAQLEALSAA